MLNGFKFFRQALLQWIILEGGTRNKNCSYFCFLNILTWKYCQITWLTGTFSSAQYVKCKPTIFGACIGILRLNILFLVNINVLIVVKSLPIVFTWENICSIVIAGNVILTNFLVNKLNYKCFLFIPCVSEKIFQNVESGNGNWSYTVNQF